MVSHNSDEIVLPASHARLLQLTFDRFSDTGEWPKSRTLQIDFLPDDFWAAVEEIDFHLIKNRGEKSQPDSQTILSVEGIAVCNGSDKYTTLFIRSLAACIDFYKKNPENPALTQSELQNLASLSEAEAQCAMGLLFIGDRIWSSASGSLAQKIAELKLYPDILRYSGVSNIEQYLEIVEQNRPRRTSDHLVYLQRSEMKGKILKAFSVLHPRVIERCENLFSDGHYSESVVAGFKVVRDRLRQLSGYERGQDAFGKGKIHIAGAAADNVDKDFNSGVKFILMAIDNFRNEKSHTSNDMIDDPVHAFEYLSLSSLAMRFLDRATTLQAEDTREIADRE